MHAQEHSTVREGLVTGLLGATIVAAWYFVFDMARGQPFYTPNVLGKVFFPGAAGPRVVPGIVAGYTVLHLVMFALAGMLLTLLVHLASRNLALRAGLWIGLVISFCFLAGLTFLLTAATGERVPLWSVVGGALASVAAMGWYLIRRHPRLQTDAQASDDSTPHAPGSPRGR